ncbi:MAG TPA: MBL fold metallo-hydrolase [Candidatus Eremiobacteraceae bacterium]|nr:MBL fold metallo-hydrolase [Candidatus Eremiobacteraceae bacterium]
MPAGGGFALYFREFYDEGLAQASYLIADPHAGVALVVDPRRDVQSYLDVAEREELRIIAVTETHIHADYLSGSRELAAASGATLMLSGEGGANWSYAGLDGSAHRLLRDGDEIAIGDVRVRALHTPGHTPEHLAFAVYDGAASADPMLLLSGDFVFVGDVGRPDLLEQAVGVAGSADAGARQMFESLRSKFLTLPDFVQVWPGHGAGSACGKAMSAVPSTTVGYERRFAWWAPFLRNGDVDGFVRELLDGQSDAPSYFARMKTMNRDGVPVLGRLPQPAQMDAEAVASALAGGATILDARDAESFATSHIKGAVNVPDGDRFSAWSAWIVPADKPVLLVAPATRVADLVRRLVRVGIDTIRGYVAPDSDGLPHSSLTFVDAGRAHDLWQSGAAVILDVRNRGEYTAEHIPGAVQIAAGRIVREIDRVPHDRALVVHCASGGRAAVAASALAARGFENITCMTGGIADWHERGYPLESGLVAM